MRIGLLQVPYHLGREGEGMGRAPTAYAEAGLAEVLRADGHEVVVLPVRRDAPFVDELTGIVDVNVALALAVEEAAARGLFPVIGGGNCNTVVGTVAGLRRARPDLGLVWCDAHGDLNTPQTTPSGYIDGMPLAMAVGLAFPQEMWGRLGDRPLAEERVVHVGGRDIDPGEEENFRSSQVQRVTGAQLAAGGIGAAAPAFDALAERCSAVHLHVDIDVVDPAYFGAVDFPTPAGLSPSDVVELGRSLARRVHISSLSVIAYNPDNPDPGGRTLRGSMDLLAALCRLAAASAPAAGRAAGGASAEASESDRRGSF